MSFAELTMEGLLQVISTGKEEHIEMRGGSWEDQCLCVEEMGILYLGRTQMIRTEGLYTTNQSLVPTGTNPSGIKPWSLQATILSLDWHQIWHIESSISYLLCAYKCSNIYVTIFNPFKSLILSHQFTNLESKLRRKIQLVLNAKFTKAKYFYHFCVCMNILCLLLDQTHPRILQTAPMRGSSVHQAGLFSAKGLCPLVLFCPCPCPIPCL